MKPRERMQARADAVAAELAAQRGVPVNAVELVDRRTLTTKVWDLGDGVKHLSSRLALVHYRDDPANDAQAWEDIDTDITGPHVGGNYRMTGTFYTVVIDPTKVAYAYNSRRGPDAAIELNRVAGALPNYSGMTVEVEGDKFWWRNVAPGVDMYLHCRPGYCEVFKVLANSSAPRQFRWQVTERDNDDPTRPARFKRETAGWETSPRRNPLEITTLVSNTVTLPGGARRFLYRETWSGRVSRIVDLQTRQRAWFTDPVYPVTIDTAITENVIAADDGMEVATDGYWNTNYTIVGRRGGATYKNHVGVRFQTVAIDAGATVSAATLTMRATGLTDSRTFGKIYGNDVDDAAAWSGSNLPSAASKTTATLTVTESAAGLKTYDVAAIVAEIVARGGWATGNDLALFILSTTAANYKYIYFEEYEDGGTDEAQLDVTFTAGGGGSILPFVAGEMGNMDNMRGMR